MDTITTCVVGLAKREVELYGLCASDDPSVSARALRELSFVQTRLAEYANMETTVKAMLELVRSGRLDSVMVQVLEAAMRRAAESISSTQRVALPSPSVPAVTYEEVGDRSSRARDVMRIGGGVALAGGGLGLGTLAATVGLGTAVGGPIGAAIALGVGALLGGGAGALGGSLVLPRK